MTLVRHPTKGVTKRNMLALLLVPWVGDGAVPRLHPVCLVGFGLSEGPNQEAKRGAERKRMAAGSGVDGHGG